MINLRDARRDIDTSCQRPADLFSSTEREVLKQNGVLSGWNRKRSCCHGEQMAEEETTDRVPDARADFDLVKMVKSSRK